MFYPLVRAIFYFCTHQDVEAPRELLNDFKENVVKKSTSTKTPAQVQSLVWSSKSVHDRAKKFALARAELTRKC